MAVSWRRRKNRELDEEIEAHLQMATQDRVERSESREAARFAALREFGSQALDSRYFFSLEFHFE